MAHRKPLSRHPGPLRKAERQDRIGARRGLVTPGDIIPQWWATSNRNGGRDHSGMVGEIERKISTFWRVRWRVKSWKRSFGRPRPAPWRHAELFSTAFSTEVRRYSRCALRRLKAAEIEAHKRPIQRNALDAHQNGPTCAQKSGPTDQPVWRAPTVSAVDLLVANEGRVIVPRQDRSRRRRWPKASLYKGRALGHAW